MWTVVYIAQTSRAAEEIESILRREGLLVTLRNIDSTAIGAWAVEVLVPESEAEEANDILLTALSS